MLKGKSISDAGSSFPEEHKKWLSQMRKGSLEMCLLGILAGAPRYGFEMVQYFEESNGLLISEGTIYPLLHRLQNQGLIAAHWQESGSGPPRKYYSLTASGQDAFARMRDEWRHYAIAVEAILARSEQGGTTSSTKTVLDVKPKDNS